MQNWNVECSKSRLLRHMHVEILSILGAFFDVLFLNTIISSGAVPLEV